MLSTIAPTLIKGVTAKAHASWSHLIASIVFGDHLRNAFQTLFLSLGGPPSSRTSPKPGSEITCQQSRTPCKESLILKKFSTKDTCDPRHGVLSPFVTGVETVDIVTVSRICLAQTIQSICIIDTAGGLALREKDCAIIEADTTQQRVTNAMLCATT